MLVARLQQAPCTDTKRADGTGLHLKISVWIQISEAHRFQGCLSLRFFPFMGGESLISSLPRHWDFGVVDQITLCVSK